MSSARLAKSMRWVRDACRNLTEYPECRMDKVAALSSLSRIVIWRPRSCPSKSGKGCPSENTAPAIEIISASVVERATDVWRREFHAIGQREAPEERKIIMPDVDRAVCTHDARSASAYTCSSVSLSVPAWHIILYSLVQCTYATRRWRWTSSARLHTVILLASLPTEKLMSGRQSLANQRPFISTFDACGFMDPGCSYKASASVLSLMWGVATLRNDFGSTPVISRYSCTNWSTYPTMDITMVCGVSSSCKRPKMSTALFGSKVCGSLILMSSENRCQNLVCRCEAPDSVRSST